jgi:hypothetical protein
MIDNGTRIGGFFCTRRLMKAQKTKKPAKAGFHDAAGNRKQLA